jgi:hypothetical protein
VVFSLCFFRVCTPLDPRLLSPCPSAAGFGASGPGEVRHSRPPGCRAQLVPGAVQRPRRPRRGPKDP